MRLNFKSIWMAALVLLIAALTTPALAQDDWDDDWGDDEESAVEISGFAEAAGGARVKDDPAASDDYTLGEARFRLGLAHYGDRAEMMFKGDFVADAVTQQTLIDIRQAWLSMRAASWLDVRAGRQILTWGTGDLFFVNDLFPKDWVSFFIGRNDEFLKAPSNTLRLTGYSNPVNVDVAWTPVFTPDRYVNGERLSFYAPLSRAIIGPDSLSEPFEAELPDETLENSELALRFYQTFGGYELALYGYHGFYKQPLGFNPVDTTTVFPALSVAGASIRGNLLGGIANIETGYYNSRDDSDGTNPFIPNSQLRTLVGYERELVARFTLGLQYYNEWLQDYDNMIASSPAPENELDEIRQLLTTRLTWRLMQETLTLSLFGYYWIEDGDTYWRPVVTRKWTDNVDVTLGANVMAGDEDTFFGQLENNTNVYLRFRYSF